MKIFRLKLAFALTLSMFHFETAFAENSEKDQIKEKLKALTIEARLEAISRAEVVEKKMDKLHRENPAKVSEIDMVQELKQICGANFDYINEEGKANVTWPTVSCKYHRATKTLGGSTNKFLCDFNEVKKSGEKVVKTRKVKYLAFTGIKNSELIPSLLASTMARMMGFYTESYCPAQIKCENCPSNMPYEFGKSEGRPSQETFDFRDAMVEMQADVMTITPNIPRSHPRHPHGLSWTEIFKVQETQKKSVREKAIEREAWLLWLNFIVEMDAHSGNQRIACDKATLKDNEVFCEKPVMYTHDYGQALFRRFQFNKWRNHISLLQNGDDSCRGGMTSDVIKSERGQGATGVEVEPIISSEARDFLVSRMRNLTDKQWRDILRISNAERLLKVKPDEFVAAVKAKIEIMSQVRCAPFDSKSTVLSEKL